MIHQQHLPHSGLTRFYDPAIELGVDVHRGEISINCRGSSELRGMAPDRAEALAELLRLGIEKAEATSDV